MPGEQRRFPRLRPPQTTEGERFQLRARSGRVARDWEAMAQRAPRAAQVCYEHLITDPYRRIPGRVFPLRGRLLRGLWEYEVTGAERLFYLPDAQREPEMSDWQPEGDPRSAPVPASAGSLGPSAERICLVLACGGHSSPPAR